MESSRLSIDVKTTGLLVFDLYESARESIESRGILEPVLRLIAGCRERDVPIFFTRPVHRADGSDLAQTLPDMDRDHRYYGSDLPYSRLPHVAADSPGSMPLREFNIGPDDYDIAKHRWSAFYGTALDLSLRTRNIDTILVVGGTTHIGVASSVYSARDLDYQIVVVRDGCHGTPGELASLLDDIFPQICHVRTVDEVLEGFEDAEF
ncbi:MAG TPA: isochorismatase family cysteine hydrolase [Acidimicrobiales bacterium]|nr:isochorismatase family cysteine hydrolase [Acidimicrobiales bacterium]